MTRINELRQRLAVVGAIKKYNKEKHKQEIRDDTIVLTVSFPDDVANPDQLKADIERSIRY